MGGNTLIQSKIRVCSTVIESGILAITLRKMRILQCNFEKNENIAM